MNKNVLEDIRGKFHNGEYVVSNHTIIEARKDGIEPHTVSKLEWIAIHEKVIEEYPDWQRVLVYAKLPKEKLSVHIVVEYSFREEFVIVTNYVPDSKYWIKYQIRKR